MIHFSGMPYDYSLLRQKIPYRVVKKILIVEIRKVLTNTYCDFAKSLLNDSGLSVEKKHEIIDDLAASFKESSRK